MTSKEMAIKVLQPYSNKNLVSAYKDLKNWSKNDSIPKESILLQMADRIQKEIGWSDLTIIDLDAFITSAIAERFIVEWDH